MFEIQQPTLIVDENRCRANIQAMAEKAHRNKVIFRPHFKTHQSAIIANWFRDYGVHSIAVSSVSMAQYFAGHGWQDITIAFPVNIRELDAINQLASKINLSLCLSNHQSFEFLRKTVQYQTGIFIETDCGYQRSGIDTKKTEEIQSLISQIDQSQFNFKGFLYHEGQSYHARSNEEIRKLYQNSVEQLNHLKNEFSSEEELIISVGDTPSLSILDNYGPVDEIRPGNFIFYDLMQHKLNACSLDKIAAIMICPVVEVHPDRHEMVIYGGAVHLSKDYVTDPDGTKNYGEVVKLTIQGWQEKLGNTYVKSLSQEHGIIKTTRDVLEQFKPGDLIGVIPVHSCLTANLQSYYMDWKGQRIEKFNP